MTPPSRASASQKRNRSVFGLNTPEKLSYPAILCEARNRSRSAPAGWFLPSGCDSIWWTSRRITCWVRCAAVGPAASEVVDAAARPVAKTAAATDVVASFLMSSSWACPGGAARRRRRRSANRRGPAPWGTAPHFLFCRDPPRASREQGAPGANILNTQEHPCATWASIGAEMRSALSGHPCLTEGWLPLRVITVTRGAVEA